MKYHQFKNIIKKFPVFSTDHLTALDKDLQVIRNQLVYWRKKGWISQLKKGFYVLDKEDRCVNPSRFYVANVLMSPSYVSMESALAFYGIIPEEVHDVISVTLKKPVVYKNEFGVFRYHHIKKEAFTGYHLIEDEARAKVMLALPEKALLDLVYFNLSKFKRGGVEVFDEDYRIQTEYKFDKKRLLAYAEIFDNEMLTLVVRQLFQKLKKGKKR